MLFLVGELVGLKIFTKGVVIVGFSKIEDINGELITLEETTSLEVGEKILEVNGTKIESIEDLKKIIILSKEDNLKMKVEDSRGEIREEEIQPIHDSSNSYKLGLWVKDSATGVGTLSFYIPETNKFACLGHGIIDSDTDTLLEIENGNLTSTKVLSVSKGSSGSPGEIKGTINPDDLGKITVNSNFGIFGELSSEKQEEYKDFDAVQVALRTEIELGEATIISNFTGERKEYKAMIDRVYLNDIEDNKSFVIRIIDDELVEATRRNYKRTITEVLYCRMEN